MFQKKIIFLLIQYKKKKIISNKNKIKILFFNQKIYKYQSIFFILI